MRNVERQQSQHSAHSLWLGIKFAQLKGDVGRVVALAARLKRQHPQSTEYQLYKKSL